MYDKIKSPDYIWRGKMWELKTITTAKSVDSALRAGLKQIAGNHGGVVIDRSCSTDALEKIKEQAVYRVSRSSRYDSVDVLIMSSGHLDVAIRCKK